MEKTQKRERLKSKKGVIKPPADCVHINKFELAQALGVSLPTIDEWMTPDEFAGGLPCVERGSNGRPYRFDLQDVLDWRGRREATVVENDAERQRLIRTTQNQLDLAGGEASGIDALAPKLRTEYYESELRRMKASLQRGSLCDAAQVEEEFQQMFLVLGRFLQALPDVLQRECTLEPGLVGLLQEKVDNQQATMARLFMSSRDLSDVA